MLVRTEKFRIDTNNDTNKLLKPRELRKTNGTP